MPPVCLPPRKLGASWPRVPATIPPSPRGCMIFPCASSSGTVTVNHESVYRNGDFFRKELLFSNSSGPVYPSIPNVAVINYYGTNGEDIVDQVIGNVWVPKNPETLLYDADGNLIQDSRWAYRWDAENRLKEMETLSGLATNVPVQKLVFTYDHQGHRASKAVYLWSLSTTNYQLSTLTRFVYDGWNLLAELDVPQGTNAPVLTKSFLWGLDLSGTPDKAGGIGGLLAISHHSTPQLSTHLPCFDGNGNVMALVHAGSGQPSARYEYAPFGEPLRVTGDAALLNPFRFSTKYTDDETGLLYYGYRYYSPGTGKWTSRDPIEEDGGINLYAFCLNDCINGYDALGQTKGGDQNKWATGWENKTLKEVQDKMKELRASGDRTKKGFIKALEAQEKMMKSPTKYGNKFGRSLSVGIGLGLTALTLQAQITNTHETASNVRDAVAAGINYGGDGAISHMFDFVRSANIGDTAMADLDAALYAAATGGSSAGALVTWAALQDQFNNW